MNSIQRYATFALLTWMTLGLSSKVSADESADTLAVYPSVRFLSPTSAELSWECDVPGDAFIEFRVASAVLAEAIDPESTGGSWHRAVLTDLSPGETYRYRIRINGKDRQLSSAAFEFDNTMNYSVPPMTQQADDQPDGVNELIERLPHLGGYAVIANPLADAWALSLAEQTSMTVVASCKDAAELQDRRRQWYRSNDYGIRLSAQHVDEIPTAFANVVVVGPSDVERGITMLAPTGWLVCVGNPPTTPALTWTTVAKSIHIAEMKRDRPLTRWDHQYGTSANRSYSGETLAGIDQTEQLEIRWLGRPGADFGIDRNPRMPAPLAVGGRLYHQGMNRMIALDAFNGAVLWSLELPQLRRVNIPRDCANWCADEQFVYAAIKDRLWIIDGATGKFVRSMLLPGNEPGSPTQESSRDEASTAGSRADESPQADESPMDWGYVATTDDVILGTFVLRGSQYEDFWSKPAWYDGKDDQATAKVCGRAIVAYDKEYGDVRWQRNVDAVIHSTITVSEDRLIFVEVEDPELQKLDTGKLTNQQIGDRAKVVCLDLKTGKELWTTTAPAFTAKQIVAFGLADDDQFLLETSSDAQFHFSSFNMNDGSPRWSKSAKWPEDHHGAHMQHAVLMNGKIYVQPQVMDATTGEILKTNTLGKRRGCATPVGTGNTIIYRGGGGPLSLWSLDRDDRSEFSRLRPSCWLSTIPAQGMLFSPEAGGGCSCGGWMECSIGFAPRMGTKKNENP